MENEISGFTVAIVIGAALAIWLFVAIWHQLEDAIGRKISLLAALFLVPLALFVQHKILKAIFGRDER